MKTAIARAFRGASSALGWYYAVAVGVPLLDRTTCDRQFFEHAAFVLAVPAVIVAMVGVLRGLLRPSNR